MALRQSSRLLELAEQISINTKIIDEYLIKKNLVDKLCFEADALPDFPAPSSEEEVHQARLIVMSATKELNATVTGPRENLRVNAFNFCDNASLHAVYNFKIPQAVPTYRDISFSELASKIGLTETNTKRIVRHAITEHIFCEHRAGYVSHSAASKLLRDDEDLAAWVGMLSNEFFPAAARMVDALEKYPKSEEPTETGFSLAHGEGLSLFQVLGNDPAKAKRFGKAMISLTGGEGYELDHLIDNYPWGDIGEGVVVDVGGSVGFVCVALAKKYPKLRFVVQDLQKTITNAHKAIPVELRDRIEFQAHDFFTEQPVKNADVYFFRWIGHNQSDKYATKMLRALIPALKENARIIFNEYRLPYPRALDSNAEKVLRTMDLAMLQALNAQERDDGDWKALFTAADPRFVYLGSTQPNGSRMSVMEAKWSP